MAVMGFDDDAIEDESADDVSSGLDGLKPVAEEQLRRVFAVADTLTRQEVGRAVGCPWIGLSPGLCWCGKERKGVDQLNTHQQSSS
jgi:hypothetical protein